MKLNTGMIVLILVAVVFGIFYFLNGNNSLTTMDAQTFKQQINKDASGIVIDVRTQKEYDDGHLVLADRHHDLLNGDFEAQLDRWIRMKPTICTVERATAAVKRQI